ncbi:MAG: hypothetical protein EOO40_09920 [Deltaproteobacteria bacterium]|nr:MAG: hypothetical protein EOO40_09920 [Deltaproteobacteria bacterium]
MMQVRRSAPRLGGLLGCILSLGACGATRHTFVAPNYDERAADAIKRIAVLGCAPQGPAGLAEVTAAVGADLVKLRKNYLVQKVGVAHQHWAEACADTACEGVLLVRTLAQTGDAQIQSLKLATALLRCRDGALLWRSESAAQSRSDDAKLVDLVATYTSDLGVAASTFAAPAFVVLQGMIEAMPDPTLSDPEIAEKLDQAQ